MTVPTATLRLSYPLYALDFDPTSRDAKRLVVAGGGGSSTKSGIGNKLTVLALDDEAKEIQISAEIDLSREEDAVSSLAVESRPVKGKDGKGEIVRIYAGVNSSLESIKKGKNEHLRVFDATLSHKTASSSDEKDSEKKQFQGKITESSRTTLFSARDPDAYQRLLRISPPLAAAATGTTGPSSRDSQIALFDLPSPTQINPNLRGTLELAKEATDMDMLRVSDSQHRLVYVDERDMYLVAISEDGHVSSPRCVFSMPIDTAAGQTVRPTFRCVRFLTETFVLAVANLPRGGGAILQGFRLPTNLSAAAGENEGEAKARLAISAKLPKHVARATNLAVRGLTPSKGKVGDAQFVVAVSGQDSSVLVYTLEHTTLVQADVCLVSQLRRVVDWREVHQGPISGLAFSYIAPPSEKEEEETPVLRLASIGSMGNTVVVHTLPLRPHPSSKPKQKRYILGLRSSPVIAPTQMIVVTAIVFALLALFLQGAMEVKGLTRPVLGARQVVPESWLGREVWREIEQHQKGKRYYKGDSLWDRYQAAVEYQRDHGQNAVVLKAGGKESDEEGVDIDVVTSGTAEGESTGKQWDELAPAQREAWKERLKRAGQWSEEMGEAVLKGVLFGEIAGVVRGLVR
ncbi:uncharacterized protein CTHT_0024240 [Thermochaetoides thermophila DSM 1495]|uniref:Guanine nucleotide-exchange factor SEC12 n=1 Tax=Chaetomium thermophilum (strain DSM 1495 / CBS 144.50 / IMI 039719) TaxID=759272 RepID=G0S5B7_CHATD|nr:hypothetical protein CTHT_0024240 [Thermochaetoides thermophila DSM 1495]EGS20590.1 hypothetical protein CTHT_0024240 [Thermochaetoides thermophila DSM 1495]